ncbi:MAG: glycosyltransferase family 4 protein [Phycisphaerales bacterium]|nr:glycosyltransferase family 4 protein [Phycisphaerales bacterium]
MRIGILTEYFPPEMGAPQARLYELAIRLRQRGHDLTIVTAMPNYPTGQIFDEYRGRLFVREKLDGLPVIRTPIFPTKSSNLIVRLTSYMSFVTTSLMMASWFVGKLDILIVESPPLFLGLSGIPMSRWTRSKLVFMVSDIWPDVAIRMGDIISDKQARILEKLEGFIYRHCACVALTNPGAVEQVTQRFPLVPCGVISNGVDTSFFKPDLYSEDIRREFGIKSGQFAVGYCGLHGIFQGLEVVVRAAARLRDNPNIRFVMVGEGPTKQKLIAMVRQEGLNNITFFPHQPKRRMPAILASMDASLIPLAASLPGTMPSKVYEALAAGVPILVTAGCEAEQLIHRYDVGRLFPAGDDETLARGIQELAADPAKRRAIRANALRLAPRFDRGAIADRTDALLRAVAQNRPLPKVEW